MKTFNTHIDFGIKGPLLRADQISAHLCIAPTSAFDANEQYWGKEKVGDLIVDVERKRPPFGVWHFSTENKIDGNSVEDHARLLLHVIGPAIPKIMELIQSTEFEVRLSIWSVGSSGFDLTSQLMAQLAGICENISIRCFDENDE